MATIDDLNREFFTDMGQEESFELLRQIRLSRRTTKKRKTASSKPKPTPAPRPSELSPEQAAQLLKLLGGS